MPAARSPVLFATAPCPCTSGLLFLPCCGKLLSGEAAAPTAETLMRSRFTGYAVSDLDYLLATWHPATRPASLDLDADLRWTRLEVLHRSAGGLLDSRGVVAFQAHYLDRGRAGVLAETSTFVRDAGRWSYVGPVSE